MKALAAYVHAKKLKFGIYTDRGSQTCMHRAGSRYHEETDAQTYAEWRVDFVKEDSCAAYVDPDKAFAEYGLMRDALNKTGRPIFFALCGWHDWYAPPMPSLNYSGGYSLGNSARINADDNSWVGALSSADVMARLAKYARPGYWNDPDLLLSVDSSGRQRMNELQSRAQFSLWCVLSAPLLISGSIARMSAYTRQTYTNRMAIDINQHGGVQGERLTSTNLAPCAGKVNCTAVWGKRTASTTWALLLLNVGGTPASVACNTSCFTQLGVPPTALPLKVTDVWTGHTSVLTQLTWLANNLSADGGHQLLVLNQSQQNAFG